MQSASTANAPSHLFSAQSATHMTHLNTPLNPVGSNSDPYDKCAI